MGHLVTYDVHAILYTIGGHLVNYDVRSNILQVADMDINISNVAYSVILLS